MQLCNAGRCAVWVAYAIQLCNADRCAVWADAMLAAAAVAAVRAEYAA